MAPRGRGGKFSKPTRGGGKHFSRDLQPLDSEGNPLGMWRDPKDSHADSSSEESSSEESSADEGGPSTASGLKKTAVPSAEMTREQRKEAARLRKQAAIQKKSRKVAAPGDLPSEESSSEESEEDEGEMPANPNHTAKARSQASRAPPTAAESAVPAKSNGTENLSRREREALQAQQARERYQKLHAEGKTDEAKADLARLKLIRAEREAAAARKQAEKEEREERERANKEKVDRESKLRAAALGTGAKSKK